MIQSKRLSNKTFMEHEDCSWCHREARYHCEFCGTPYCGDECQFDDWSSHKKYCVGAPFVEYVGMCPGDDLVIPDEKDVPEPPQPPQPPPPPPGILPPPTEKKKVTSVTRPVHWKKIAKTASRKTVFDKYGEEVRLDVEDKEILKNLFSKTVRPTGSVAKGEVRKLSDKTMRIDIILAGMKSPTAASDLATWIKMGDAKKIGPMFARELQKLFPDERDIQVMEKEESPAKLRQVERFVYELSKMSHPKERLDAIVARHTFDEKTAEISDTVEKITHACRCVEESTKFALVMAYLLAYGNYLNAGTKIYENASGFTMGSLKAFSDSVGNNRAKLIQVICAQVYMKEISLRNLSDQLGCVKEAKSVTGNSLFSGNSDIDVLEVSLNTVKEIMTLVESDKEFLETMKSFVIRANGNLSDAKTKRGAFVDEYKKFCEFLGEDTDVLPPDEMFVQLQTFVDSWDGSMKEIEKKEIEQKKREERRAAAQQRARESQLKKRLRDIKFKTELAMGGFS